MCTHQIHIEITILKSEAIFNGIKRSVRRFDRFVKWKSRDQYFMCAFVMFYFEKSFKDSGRKPDKIFAKNLVNRATNGLSQNQPSLSDEFRKVKKMSWAGLICDGDAWTESWMEHEFSNDFASFHYKIFSRKSHTIVFSLAYIFMQQTAAKYSD